MNRETTMTGLGRPETTWRANKRANNGQFLAEIDSKPKLEEGGFVSLAFSFYVFLNFEERTKS